MENRDIIHLSIGTMERNTKSGCGKRIIDFPRGHASVEYRNRRLITCDKCRAKADKIAKMRGDH